MNSKNHEMSWTKLSEHPNPWKTELLEMEWMLLVPEQPGLELAQE